jgi:hypothetical protein
MAGSALRRWPVERAERAQRCKSESLRHGAKKMGARAKHKTIRSAVAKRPHRGKRRIAMINNWKNRQTIALVSLVIAAPWLIGLAFGPSSLVQNTMMAGLLAASILGVAALVTLGMGLFRST